MTHHAGHERQIVAHDRFAEQRLGDAGTEPLGDRDDLVASGARSLTDEDRDPVTGVEHRGGGGECGIARQHTWRHPSDRARHDPVLLGALLGHVQALDIVRDDDARGRSLCLGGAHRPVHHELHLLRCRDRRDIRAARVGEQRAGIDLLLVPAAEHRLQLLRHDRHHRTLVQLRVVQAVEQMNRTRPVGSETAADGVGPLAVGGGHERRRLLVPSSDERRRTGSVEGSQDWIDPIAREPEDAVDAPGSQTGDQDVGELHDGCYTRRVLPAPASTASLVTRHAFHCGSPLAGGEHDAVVAAEPDAVATVALADDVADVDHPGQWHVGLAGVADVGCCASTRSSWRPRRDGS